MSSFRGEVSQLVSKNGTKPSSNLDSFRLHSFYSNLPVFRKKYDWNVPKWSDEDIINLHKLVRTIVVENLSSKIQLMKKKLNYNENQRILEIINNISSHDLYLIYLNFDFGILSSKMFDLVRSDDYSEFLESLLSSPNAFNVFKDLYLPNKPKFQDFDLSVFWDTVASRMNENTTRAMSFKISTDCCVKFINSTSDGVLLNEVSKNDFSKIENFLSNTNRNQALKSCIENSVYLGVSVYQYLKVLLHEGRTNKWDSTEDSMLMELVTSKLDHLEGDQGSSKHTWVSWKNISRNLPGKTAEQCRLRYRQIKKKKLVDSPFQIKEMNRLRILKAAYGNNWSKISNMMPGRSSRQCRDKVLISTQYSKENALESLEYFRQFLSEFPNYLNNNNINKQAKLSKPPFVNRYWKHLDWLGLYFINILNITKNEHLLEILRNFYFSNEIIRRIDILFKPSENEYLAKCTGSDICSISNFLREIASLENESKMDKVMNINKTLVKMLFKRCTAEDKINFKNFDVALDFNILKESVYNSLKTLWP